MHGVLEQMEIKQEKKKASGSLEGLYLLVRKTSVL